MDKRRCLSDGDMETLKHIMAKCGGLPKVITSIAEYYSSNERITLETIHDNFMDVLKYSVHSLNGLFSWMQSYLETCEDELKPCIFYLPIFPVDHDIRRRRLVWRWMAEGYSRDRSSRTAEKDGENLLYNLLFRSIIQQHPSSKRSQYRVNGFFHEYITSRPMKDNLVLALEGSCTPNSERVGRHLTIRSSWDRDMTVFRSTDFSRLRSFTVFGKCRPFMFDSTNTKMKHVRVLDLEDASGVTDDYLEGIVELLPRLKFLSLRGCKEITRLPWSLGSLRQLQTLDVRYTSIATLPDAILKLHKLQYFRAGTAHNVPWDEGGIMVPCQPATPAEEAAARSSAPAQYSTTAAAAPIAEEVATTTVAEVPMLLAGDATIAAAAPRSRTHALVPSWLSKLYRRCRLDSTNGGVEVPAGFGDLTSLNTLGIANVEAGKAATILKELHKLSQLHRLGVSGVNPDNIHEFFSSISGLCHLEYLTVRVDKNKQGLIASLDNTISAPRNTLKSLKLHGHVRIARGSWIKEQDLVDYGKKVDLETTVESQRDMHVVFEELMAGRHLDGRLKRLCVKPIQKDGERILIESTDRRSIFIDVLEIVCTTDLHATIGEGLFIDVLKVHCSTGSSLQLSGLQRRSSLKEVWLKGSYSDVLKQDLQRQIATNGYPKTVLKLLQPRSS